MRMLLRVSMPVEAGNAAAQAGTLGSTVERIVADLKPEAAFFFIDDNGDRLASAGHGRGHLIIRRDIRRSEKSLVAADARPPVICLIVNSTASILTSVSHNHLPVSCRPVASMAMPTQPTTNFALLPRTKIVLRAMSDITEWSVNCVTRVSET